MTQTPSKIRIRTALPDDLPMLISLWQRVFKDEESFIRAFYQASDLRRTLAAVNTDEVIVGMLNCPAIELWHRQTVYRGVYLYAFAVDEAYRGYGIGSKLLQAAENGSDLPSKPDFALLIPAEPSLFDFYAAKGYDRFAYNPIRKALSTKSTEISSVSCLPVFSDTLYARYLNACGYISASECSGAIFVKPPRLFTLSMEDTECFPTPDGYNAFQKEIPPAEHSLTASVSSDRQRTLVESMPAIPDPRRPAALWKALIPIPEIHAPLISRFLE